MDFAPLIARKSERFRELEAEISSSNLYDDPRKAREILREHTRLKELLAHWETLKKSRAHLVENQELAKGEDKDKELLARGRADYLAEGQGRGSGLAFEVQKSLDSSVGFGSAPAAAKMATASKNVGVNSVVGGWAYQGSRAAHNQGSIFNAQGKYLNSINAKDGRAQWQAEVDGKSVSERSQVFSPPSLGREYMYLASSTGSLVSVRQKDGQVGFAYSFKKPMVFQPALVDGNVYVGTGDGLLICLKTNEKDADGWYQ